MKTCGEMHNVGSGLKRIFTRAAHSSGGPVKQTHSCIARIGTNIEQHSQQVLKTGPQCDIDV